MNTINDAPLKSLNVFVLPLSIILAVTAGGFWAHLLYAMVGGGFVAHVLATLWLARFKALAEAGGPLAQLSMEMQGGNDPSLHARFIFMQSISGSIVSALWYIMAYGLIAIFT